MPCEKPLDPTTTSIESSIQDDFHLLRGMLMAYQLPNGFFVSQFNISREGFHNITKGGFVNIKIFGSSHIVLRE